MLELLGVVAAAGGPALFWLWVVWRRDRFEAEPRRLVFATFLLGGFSTLPAALAESALGGDLELAAAGLAGLAISAVAVVGPVEELAKFLVVWRLPYQKRAFNEPLDGLVYAAAAAMGFAAVENLAYVAAHGVAVMLLRGPISTLAHLLFALPYGLALGRARVGRAGAVAVVGALLAAALGHGLFDLFLSAAQVDSLWALLALLVAPLVAILIRGARGALRQAEWESPFRRRG